MIEGVVDACWLSIALAGLLKFLLFLSLELLVDFSHVNHHILPVRTIIIFFGRL
jgi:hypothetical protein